MYRDYEDPRAIERAIDEWGRKYEQARELGASRDTLRDIGEYIDELKQRAAFAWDDDAFSDTREWTVWELDRFSARDICECVLV